jgi:hypothetical protein
MRSSKLWRVSKTSGSSPTFVEVRDTSLGYGCLVAFIAFSAVAFAP